MRYLCFVCACAFIPSAVQADPSFDDATLQRAAQLRDRALKDDGAFATLRSLTTEVGPRPAGSTGDAKAVAWAQAKLTELGFSAVHAEPVKVPHWERGSLTASVTAPERIALHATSLGGSVGTGGAPLEAQVVPVASVAALAHMTRAELEGRIVYFYDRMPDLLDGSGYGETVGIRTSGPAQAAKLGAVAVVIRTVGTNADDEAPHTGTTKYKDGVPKIPAIAISNPDADRLETLLAGSAPVRISLSSTALKHEDTMSANVVGEIPGSDLSAGIVLLGAHLDSWDLATGAQDDGAGVAIVSEAARLIAPLHPRRTVRVVLFANEEAGLDGAHAYAIAHAIEADRIVAAIEADLGSGRVWGIASRAAPEGVPAIRAMVASLADLGIRYFGNDSDESGADVNVIGELGVPQIELAQDAHQYFRIHHSPNDDLAHVDPKALKQALAAYATIAYLSSELHGDLGRAPPKLD